MSSTEKAAESRRLLAALLGPARCAGALDDSENLVLAHDQEFFAVDLDFGTAVLAEKDAVSFLHVESLSGTVLFVFSFSGRDDLTLLWLFLCGVWNDDATAYLLALFNPSDDHAVMKRSDFCCHMPTTPFDFT